MRKNPHSLSYSQFYRRWVGMRNRCSNPSHKCFSNYGGRGIFVCEEWKVFSNFKSWCDKTYEEGKSIDRIDNDGPYSSNNCKWSTRREQQLNRRCTEKMIQGLKVTRTHLVKMFHEKYGDPATRTEIKCSRCHIKKPTFEFDKKGTGNTTYCKMCMREYRLDRK